jgi:hypothetical protein
MPLLYIDWDLGFSMSDRSQFTLFNINFLLNQKIMNKLCVSTVSGMV